MNNLRYADGNPVKRENEEELKTVLMRMNEESRNLAENSTFRRPKSESVSIMTRQIEMENVDSVTDLIFFSFQITLNGDCRHGINRNLLPGGKAMTNIDLVLKRRDMSLLTNVPFGGGDKPLWFIQ